MKLRKRFVLSCLGVGLGLLAAACGSGSSPSSSSPVAVTPVVSVGATIHGTVLGGPSGSAGAGALAEGQSIRVSVVGTSLSASTDSSGRFVLTDVPSGRVELRFEGPGIDARLEISGLVEGQTLDITVRVSGSQAGLVPPGGEGEVAFRGAVEAKTPSLRIAGRTVQTNAATVVLGRDNAPMSLANLNVGDEVEVEGLAQADGSVLARKIKLEDQKEDQQNGAHVQFTGPIQKLSPLTVADRQVVLGRGARILDRSNNPIAFDALKVGNVVEVEGTLQADGSVLAEKIKLQD